MKKPLCIFLLLKLILTTPASMKSVDPPKKVMILLPGSSDYWTTQMEISYLDANSGTWIVDGTEAGRYNSLSKVFDVKGIVVPILTETTADLPEQEDNFACKGPFVKNYPSDEPWIALIRKGECSFDEKIANVMKLNPSGIIIYDNNEYAILQEVRVENLGIPLAFTYQKKGLELVQLVKSKGRVFIYMTNHSHCKSLPFMEELEKMINLKKLREALNNRNFGLDSIDLETETSFKGQEYCGTPETWSKFILNVNKLLQSPKLTETPTLKQFRRIVEYIIIFIVTACCTFTLASLTAIFCVYCLDKIRTFSTNYEIRKALQRIPTVVLELEDIASLDFLDTCAICHDQFKTGEVIRKLPCKHPFHKVCIDRWLKRNPVCPLCKLNLTEHYGI